MTKPEFRRPLTRFAPSPTGHLHLGHVAHMLYVWGLAGVLDGSVLLRIEDHDRQRSRPEFEAALLEDLDWLGFPPVNALTAGPSEFRQSDCEERYRAALETLSREHRVYRCVCTRKSLAGAGLPGPAGERAYDGRCREAKHPAGFPHGLRIEWNRDAAPESFVDGLAGPQEQSPERQCGDLLLRDRLGNWTYQFAVSVDDCWAGIDFVVRGSDLLESTGRQIRLGRMLGRDEPPKYFHHPLVSDAFGVKLSKKQRAPAVRDLRQSGSPPARVLGEAAKAAGLSERAIDLVPSDAPDLVLARHGAGLAAAGGDLRLDRN